MKKISTSKLSQIVQKKRSELGLTQEELGKLTKINRLLIGKLEAQKFIPSIPQMESILKELNITLDEIIEEEDSESVFIALNGEAKTEKEHECIDRFISMMLCLRKHETLRRKLNV